MVANGVKVWTDGDTYLEQNPVSFPEFAANGNKAFVVRDATGTALIGMSDSLIASEAELSGVRDATMHMTTKEYDLGHNDRAPLIATKLFPAQWDWDLDDPTIDVPQGVRDTQVQITVSTDRASLDASLRKAAMIGVLIRIATTIAAGAAVWRNTSRALQPLNTLADQAADIDEPTDAAPFDTHVPAELWPIADRFNNLLIRLQRATLSERRFTADAAHELRTPIAELRTLTDVALAFPDDSERLESVVQTSNELSIRLTSLVDALLGTARGETFMRDMRKEEIDMPALLQRILEENGADSANSGLHSSYDGPTSHIVETDAALLTSVLINLIGNAFAHSSAGATIRINYSGGQQGFRLDVTNPASDLDPADVEMLFEPFWRKQGSHSDRSHSGLGLTLSQNFSDLLGFQLDASLLRSGDLQLTLANA